MLSQGATETVLSQCFIFVVLFSALHNTKGDTLNLNSIIYLKEQHTCIFRVTLNPDVS